MRLRQSHVVSVSQFEREDLNRIFALADRCLPLSQGIGRSTVLAGRLLINLFFEPSTRTRLSFGSAFLRLGGAVESTVDESFSSMAKGETLEDTIRVIDGYADAIVLRHKEKGAAARAAAVARKPVLNAGDGPGEHPTQALLDCYTLLKERGRIEGLTIAMIGDLVNGRTVHSLSRLLAHFDGVKLIFASPDLLAMPQSILDDLTARGLQWQVAPDLRWAVERADVLYVTRLQAERFSDPAVALQQIASFVVNRQLLESTGRSDITLLHPLPRVHDLATDVDDLPGAAYFRQAHYGVPVRMALFCEIFGVEP
jgi:aspartate carbamoyltransferase catalytic subunit